MKTTNTKGTWEVDKHPSSLILNYFEVTDIIGENTQKVNALLNNIKKETSLLAFGVKNNNTIVIEDFGMKWVFDVTIHTDGNHGLLFIGLKK